MTRKEVIVRALAGKLTWIQAADILDMTPRHLRRLRRAYEHRGYDGLQDQRGKTPRRQRIPVDTIARGASRQVVEIGQRALPVRECG